LDVFDIFVPHKYVLFVSLISRSVSTQGCQEQIGLSTSDDERIEC